MFVTGCCNKVPKVTIEFVSFWGFLLLLWPICLTCHRCSRSSLGLSSQLCSTLFLCHSGLNSILKLVFSLCDDFDDHLTSIIYSLGSFTTTLCDSVLSFTYEFAFKDFLKMKQLQ